MKLTPLPTRLLLASSVLLAGVFTSGCAPLIYSGLAVGSVMVHADRRSAGTQVEDQSIAIKAASRANAMLEGRAHLNFTSFNRVVLITGEVPTLADRNAVSAEVARVEQVRHVVNEAAVMPPSYLAERSNDASITLRVRSTLLSAGDVESSAFKIVTERGIVYLMGLVSAREAERAVSLVRQVGGVLKVVQVTEPITDDEVINLRLRSSRTSL